MIYLVAVFLQVVVVEFFNFEMEFTSSCNSGEIDHITWNNTSFRFTLWNITLIVAEDAAHKLFVRFFEGVLGVALFKWLVKFIKLSESTL